MYKTDPQHFVGPDLDPDCLQSYQQMILASKELNSFTSLDDQYKKSFNSHKFKYPQSTLYI